MTSPPPPRVDTDNLLFEVTLRGPLDASRLLAALQALHAQFDALGNFDSPQLRDLSTQEQPEEQYEALAQQQALLTFDKGKSPWRSQLLCLNDDHHVWLLVQPATHTDAASCEALWQWLAAHYHQQSPCAFPAIASVRKALQQAFQSKQARDNLQFFGDRSARSVETHRFYHSTYPSDLPAGILRISRALTAPLASDIARHLARSTADASPDPDTADNFFQTVLLATLRRLGGNREQALGVALRNASPPPHGSQNTEPATFGPLGNFTHWTALCVDLEDTDSFADLAARVKQDALAIGQHAFAEFDQLPAPDAPTFEVLCQVQPNCLAKLPGLTLSSRTRSSAHFSAQLSAQFSSRRPQAAVCLTVQYAADGSNYQLQFDFDSQRFTHQDAQRFTEHTEQLLRAATHDWQESIANALMISDRERQQLLALNPEDSPVGPDVIAAFEAQVERRPEHCALRFDSVDLSYTELNQKANQMAHALRSAGVQSGDWVALVLNRGVELVASLLACLKLGAAYVPLDPSHPAARNGLVLDVAQPKAIVTQGPVSKDLQEIAQCQVLCVEQLLEHSPTSPENPASSDRVGGLIAYVIFTSGSTGKPKGVQVQRSALANFLSSMQQVPGFGENDALLSVTTISFDIAALEIFLPLTCGGWLEMVDRLVALNPKQLMTRLDSGDFSVLQATPATWRMLIESGWQGTPKLKALCGGEALPPALAQQLCERTAELWNMYGPTETTVWSTVERVEANKKGISIGRPIANTQVYLLDDQQGLVPQGVIGELTIGGQGVTMGYAGLPELTAEKFLSDPFHPAANARMYRTGDLGRWLADGTLECLGRVDFQVKIRGFRIELGEIESAIALQGSLPEALVVARELTAGDPRLVAYGKTSEGFDVEVLREFLQERLPSYMVPSFFVPLGQWPLTPNGKIDRKALPNPDDSHRAAHQSNEQPPATELERRIAAIWCTTLNTPSIGRQESLFAAGGSSLDAIRLLTALSSLPEGEVTLGTFLLDPTVAGIATALEQPAATDEPVVVSLNQVESTSEKPAVFCVCGIHLYSELAYSMQDYPVVGIYLPIERQILEMDESKPGVTLPSLEEIATAYIETIVEQQPEGPYLLAGVSFGGVLVYEIAQQLRERDQQVGLLAMFDSLLSESYHFHFGSWLNGHLKRARSEGMGYVLERPGVQRRLSKVPGLQRGVARLLRQKFEQSPTNDTSEPETTPLTEREREDARMEEMRGDQLRIFDLLIKRYEPRMRSRSGDALFFRAMNDEQFPGYEIDSDGGWHKWVQGQLAVHSVPGSHLGILKGDSAQLIATRLLEAIAHSNTV